MMRTKFNLTAALIPVAITAGVSLPVGGIGYFINGVNGRAKLDNAVYNSRSVKPSDGTVVTLLDDNTIQIQKGTVTQTFSFTLERVYTVGRFETQMVEESANFPAYPRPQDITDAAQKGCLVAEQIKDTFTNYDYGWLKTGSEYRIPGEQVAFADRYIAKHCAKPAP